MEDFIVSARKYRPQVFDTVVGQESITQTLLKAIENNHLAQAFLFCGPRGVGKTTCARILARTVNAHSMGSDVIDTDYSFNIFELDAASNNSVEDIRNLIDQVRIPPQIGKYKVYIIDEVHMLSTNAFNAFLKTLEEPPAYAIFILATTEKHKVLPTILSRCQVFDFNRIQIPDIVDHLSKIAEKEGIEAGHDALHIIAEKADGALRDALSIFDQVVGFSGNKVTYQDVIANLNILDYDYYFAMTDSFLKDEKSEVLLTFNTILNNGFDGHNFLNGLANHFRNLLFCTSDRTAGIMEVGNTVKQRYIDQSKKCDPRFMLNALSALSDADINYKSSKNPRLLVELTLLKLCSLAAKLSEKKKPESDLVFSDDSGLESNFSDSYGQVESSPSGNSQASTPPAPSPTLADMRASDEAKKSSEEQETEPPIQTDQTTPTESSPVDNQPEPAEEENKSDSTPASHVSEPAPNEKPPQQDAILPQKKEELPGTSAGGELKQRGFSSRLGKAKSKVLPSLQSLGNSSANQGESIKKTVEEIAQSTSVLHENRPANEFNLGQLWKAWDEYAAQIKEEDKQSYYATLTKHKPVMRDKFQIELLVDNHVQKSDLDADKVRILEFLREKLNNWKVQLEGVIDEEEGTDGDSLYEPQKKYEAMVEKNPTLAKMKRLFDLEVDYDS